jgi:hypothetical protein
VLGWIKLHRQIQKHWLWMSEKPFDKRSAWIDMLLMANHDNNKFVLGNELVEVKRGSFITSELKLMERWGWSKTKVRNFLDLLKRDSMIVKKSDRKKTTITIVNYSDYQDTQTTEKPQEDHEETAKKPQEDINKNDKNDKNDKKLVIDPFLLELMNNLKEVNNYPFDFDKDAEFLKALLVDFPTINIQEQIKKWAIYILDNPFKKKSNPRSQFRNWCKNAAKWQKEKTQKQKTWGNKAYQPWEPPRD